MNLKFFSTFSKNHAKRAKKIKCNLAQAQRNSAQISATQCNSAEEAFPIDASFPEASVHIISNSSAIVMVLLGKQNFFRT